MVQGVVLAEMEHEIDKQIDDTYATKNAPCLICVEKFTVFHMAQSSYNKILVMLICARPEFCAGGV